MNIEELRAYALSKSGVEEGFPFGQDTLVFKVGGKMFLLTSLSTVPLEFNVKCDPDKAIALREQYDCVQPGYHMNKKHWNTVVVDGTLGNKMLMQMIDESYDLVKKKTRK